MHHLEGGPHSQHGTPQFGSVTQSEEVERMKSQVEEMQWQHHPMKVQWDWELPWPKS